MTKLTHKANMNFGSLKLQLQNATDEVERRRAEASVAGRPQDELRLLNQRAELDQKFFDILDAERAYIRSTMTVAQAEQRLRRAASDARAAVKGMKSIAATINQAARLISLLTGLAGLFP